MGDNSILTFCIIDSQLGLAADVYFNNSLKIKFSIIPRSSHQSAHNMFIEYRLRPRRGEFHACDSCTRFSMGR